MIKDPNAIYDEAGQASGEQKAPPVDPKPGPGDPKPKPKKVHPGDAYESIRRGMPQTMGRAGSSFQIQGVEQSDQGKFFGDIGIYDPALSGQDIALHAGERQSFGNKLARRLGNFIPNVAADLIDIVGSVGSLVTEWGDDRDYRNGLNDIADSIKNPFGKNYARSNDTWALGDPTWWIDNVFNTLEYAAGYALAGTGIAKTIGKGVQALGSAAELTSVGMNWASRAGQLGTSALVSYAQAAQSGMGVFKETYDNQFMKALAAGKSQEEAHNEATHIAAQSAATTAQLGTILTMAINSGAYAPMFRTQEALTRDIIAGRLASQTGVKSLTDVAKAIRGLDVKNYTNKLIHHAGWKGVVNEMWKEGGEEVLQQFAEQTGYDIGKDGKIKGLIDQLGEMENIIDRTANSQGALAFVLGAGFGGAQHGLIHNVIPSKRVTKMVDGQPVQKMVKNDKGEEVPMTDKNGNPVFVKTWVTPRKYEYDHTQKTFDNMKDAVAEDFENMEELRNQFLEARKNKNTVEAERIRNEMFDPSKLFAIKAGLTDAWVKTFEKISGMDQAAAMENGFAMHEEDTEYKEKATEAVGDIKHLEKVYNDLKKKYGMQFEENQELAPYVDMLFGRHASLYSADKNLAFHRKKLAEAEAEELSLANIEDPTMVNLAHTKWVSSHNSMVEVFNNLVKDRAALRDAALSGTVEGAKVVDRLMRKYRAVGYGNPDPAAYKASVQDLLRKIDTKSAQIEEQMKASQQALFDSTDYNEWVKKNPGKTFDEFIQEANKRTSLSGQNRYYKSQIDGEQARIDIERENLADMTKTTSMTKFSSQADKWRKEMEKAAEATAKKGTATLTSMTKDAATLKRLGAIAKNQIADRYAGDYEKFVKFIAANERRIAVLQAELKRVHKKDPLRASAIRKQLRILQKQQVKFMERAAVLKTLSEQRADVSESTEDQDVEDVTGEQDGKTVSNADEAPTTNTQPGDSTEQTAAGTAEATTEEVAADAALALTAEEQADAMIAEIAGEAPEPEFEVDPFKEYGTLFNNARPAVQAKMGVLLDEMINNNTGFSLDFLNPEINAGLISQPEAHKLLLAARDYAKSVQATIAQQQAGALEVEEESSTATDDLSSTDNGEEIPTNIQEFAKILTAEKVNFIFSNALMDGLIKPNGTLNMAAMQRKFGIGRVKAKRIAEAYGALPGPAAVKQGNTPPIIVEPVSTPDTPVLESETELGGTVPEGKAYHAGHKIVNAATTGATATIDYEEGTKKGPNGETVYVKITKKDALLKPITPMLLTPGAIKPGQKLRYEIDVDYDGPKQITDSLSWDDDGNVVYDKERGADYLDGNGKVKLDAESVANVPIRVVDAATGQFLCHIRKMDWVTAKFPGTQNYRNVATETEENADNMVTQMKLLMQIRTSIVEKFNADGLPTEGAISQEGLGTGRLILNHVIESKNEEDLSIKSKIIPQLAYNRKDPTRSLLPQADLQLVIVLEGGVPYSGKGFPFPHAMGIPEGELMQGGIGAMVQAVNGEYMYAPLVGMKLVEEGRPSPGLSSVTRAIELFLLNDGTDPNISKEILELEQNTDFNVGNAQGLRAFINQYYTYMQDFKDSALSPNANTGSAAEQFVFSVNDKLDGVADKTKQVKVGFTMRGSAGLQYANIVNGKLSPAFVEVLTEGFTQRARAVVFTDASRSIKGINSSGFFYDATYVPGKGWVHNQYDDYNQYVKSFSKTAVYGRNQLPDGTYVYTANPHINLTVPGKQIPQNIVTANNTASTVKAPEKTQVDLDAELFDELTNLRPNIKQPVAAIGTGPENSIPLTFGALEESHNFTPEDQRNGRTVLEVYDELTGHGLTYIPEGYNPFSRCS